MEVIIKGDPEEIEALIKLAKRSMETEAANEVMIRLRDALIQRREVS